MGWWRNLLHSLCTFCTFSNTAAGPNPVTRVSKGCAEMYISPHRSDHNSRHKCTVDVELGLKPVVTTMAGTPLNRNWMSLCLEIILFGRFLQQDQGLPSHVPGTIWLCSTQFWLKFLGFSSILKGTPCMLSYVHIWAGTLSTLLLSLISKGIITASVYIPSDLYQIQ